MVFMTGTQTDQRYRTPGVYLEDSFAPPRNLPFTTGVPLLLGLTGAVPRRRRSESEDTARLLTLWSQFTPLFGDPRPGGYLAEAVHGFFRNGGEMCFVLPLSEINEDTLNRALESTEYLSAIDLVCVPDLGMQDDPGSRLRQIVVNHCEKLRTRFAILDSRARDDREKVWSQWEDIDGSHGALYYPWIRITGCDGALTEVPPCGHIAGIYSRSDRRVGVHKAPANESVDGALALARPVTDADQAELNPRRVNCLRSFPGRGVRVWGARTLSGLEHWKYVNVRRLFVTAARWIEWNMFDMSFETNDASLWARVERELNTYFIDQFRRGALKGGTPQEAFYVKCDAETNPPDLRQTGRVMAEIGLAPAVPYEFIVTRMLHGPRGATLAGPARPEQQI